MNNMFMTSYFLIILFFLFFLVSISLHLKDIDLMFEWLIYSDNSVMIELFILIDWISILFISFITLISSMIMLYSVTYMESDKFIDRFMYLMILFILSMLMMILSPSLLSILFGWDLLGLISFCLVIYYQNLYSYNSGMVTVLSNRIGDVGLLMSIGMLITNGSWNIYLFKNNYLLMFMISLAAATKSAQIPFSSWLPMAMSAPTPVSALVHSSTLVTAGVYLIIRFNTFIMISKINMILLFISIFTMIMSGIMAMYEFDLKKIIALSTLNQLGIMMMSLSLGFKILAFYHLLTHAIFKSLLFMCAGMIIHSTYNNQDIRYYGKLKENLPFISMSFFISILSLMGVPFMSGFYSKDLIIEMLYTLKFNVIYFIVIMMSLMLTVLYSLRLFYHLFFSKINHKTIYSMNEDSLINISMMMLILLSMIMGSTLNWLFFYNINLIMINKLMKIIVLTLIMTSVLSWIIIQMIKLINLKYIKMFILFNSNMWLLNLLYVMMNKYSLKMMEYFNMVDLVWIENIESKIWFKIKLMIMKNYFFKFKLYKLIYSYIIISLIITLMLF